MATGVDHSSDPHEKHIHLDERSCRQIYDTTSIGIARVSLDSKIEHANPAYCDILGYTEEELVGRHLKDFVHPDDRKKNLSMQKELAEGNIDHYRMEKRFIRGDRGTVTCILDANLVRDDGGNPDHCIGTLVDVTSQRKAEQKLREGEELFKSLMESCGNGIILQDREGTIVFWNKTAEDMFEIPAEEILNTSALDRNWETWDADGNRVSADEHPSIHTLGTGEPCSGYLMKVGRSDGSLRWLSINTRPVYISDGDSPDLVIINFNDITELKHTQEELLSALQTRDDLFRELKHRVKNTFSSLNSLTNLELLHLEDPSARDALQKLMQRMKTFSQLYNLLDQDRTGTRKIHMDRYFSEIIHSLQNTLSTNIGRVRVETDFEKIRLDIKLASPWGLILNELITNAYKYAFKGRDSGSISVSFKRSEGCLVLRVSDDGCGLAESAETGASGGLGFMLIKSLADQLGAEFFVDGSAGTTCTVRTPADP